MSKKRVVVEVPEEMAAFLEDRAKLMGVGNVSALLRLWIAQEMQNTALRTMAPNA